jgi:hypothetical protein
MCAKVDTTTTTMKLRRTPNGGSTSSKGTIRRCLELNSERKRCRLKVHRERGYYCHIHRKLAYMEDRIEGIHHRVAVLLTQTQENNGVENGEGNGNLIRTNFYNFWKYYEDNAHFIVYLLIHISFFYFVYFL